MDLNAPNSQVLNPRHLAYLAVSAFQLSVLPSLSLSLSFLFSFSLYHDISLLYLAYWLCGFNNGERFALPLSIYVQPSHVKFLNLIFKFWKR